MQHMTKYDTHEDSSKNWDINVPLNLLHIILWLFLYTLYSQLESSWNCQPQHVAAVLTNRIHSSFLWLFYAALSIT